MTCEGNIRNYLKKVCFKLQILRLTLIRLSISDHEKFGGPNFLRWGGCKIRVLIVHVIWVELA